MPFTDMPLEQLRAFRPEVREPPDFDEFWASTLAESRAAAHEPASRVAADTPITELVVEDLTFPGFGGEPIKGWVAKPLHAEGPLPAVVEYNGYNGGRGIAGEHVLWALSGYLEVFMDTRGQGSGWGTGGDTPDPHGSTASAAGWMTQGILDPAEHYYRRVFTDAVRLLDEVATWDDVDESRIVVTGASQGGGISIAAAGLSEHVAALMPDVAFLCAWEHATEVALNDPYQELARYLAVHRDHAERVWTTASYFDGVNFAKRIQVPSLFSVALMDETVPPSSTFAAYNTLAADRKEMVVYPYNNHEGGQTRQWVRQAEFLARLG